MSNKFYTDIHCHPSIKAYAKSYRNTPGVQSSNHMDESCIWREDKPSLFDKVKNYTATLTNFVQSDGTSLLQGKMGIICLSFYPQEKGFFKNKLGKGLPADMMTTMVTEFSKQRIDHIQNLSSYWEDFKKEIAFVLQHDNQEFTINNKKVRYKVARSYKDIQEALDSGELGESLVLFVPTIEGLHIFDQVMDNHEHWQTHAEGVSPALMDEMLKRAAHLRAGSDGLLRPSFVTLAHHFWNGLCGHERSLGSTVQCTVDQENGLGTGLTEAGKKVLRVLLDERKDENGNDIKPVVIDIKHMSMLSKREFFSMLDNEFPVRNIPVVCSHGGVNGLSDPLHKQQNTPAAREELYMDDWINIFDYEIIRIEESGGLFGIQLDERRIGSKKALKKARFNVSKKEILEDWAKLVWNQIRHMGELLDQQGRFAWGIQCLGADFDGIIDPINGYWTAASMDELEANLITHARNYLTKPHSLQQERNKNISPEDLVHRVMTQNTLDFLAKNF